ncbi:glycosyl transferase family 1 [Helicobacter anseris]|uniref:Glycosyl transferase family 1 n=1 Tax=Helicobacter anseris TaxID=375926 RepID=A0A3D8J9A0_9HELI|nr:glycosyltransferase [Helicobacter anseris]RDU73870.1 glycosyl transferase family 1 [Helicobacter anseris]
MKILHLVSQDNGGAGRAAIRLHLALLKQGIDSQVMVQNKTQDLPTIHSLTQTKTQKFFIPFKKALDQLPSMLYKNRHNDIFSSTFFPSNKNLLRKINEINPDIIHLHWINSGFIYPSDLTHFNRPIIWSLHDANPYTGGCHVVYNNCDKFKTLCYSCPFLASNFKYDISFLNFKKKQKAYNALKLTVNGLSSWIASEAKASALFKNKNIINIPNPIDTDIFRPIKKDIARKILNLNCKDKILIGFGAISGTQIKRKGYLQLKEALEMLPNKHLYTLIVFGSSDGEKIAGIDTIFMGHLYDDTTLTLLYNSLDIFITPSLAENLSNTIMESLSCGVPVVAFDIGGNVDMIIHKTNGYLARDVSDLSYGICWALKNLPYLSQNAREMVIERFSYNVVAKRYIAQYQYILENL